MLKRVECRKRFGIDASSIKLPSAMHIHTHICIKKAACGVVAHPHTHTNTTFAYVTRRHTIFDCQIL